MELFKRAFWVIGREVFCEVFFKGFKERFDDDRRYDFHSFNSVTALLQRLGGEFMGERREYIPCAIIIELEFVADWERVLATLGFASPAIVVLMVQLPEEQSEIEPVYYSSSGEAQPLAVARVELEPEEDTAPLYDLLLRQYRDG